MFERKLSFLFAKEKLCSLEKNLIMDMKNMKGKIRLVNFFLVKVLFFTSWCEIFPKRPIWVFFHRLKEKKNYGFPWKKQTHEKWSLKSSRGEVSLRLLADERGEVQFWKEKNGSSLFFVNTHRKFSDLLTPWDSQLRCFEMGKRL